MFPSGQLNVTQATTPRIDAAQHVQPMAGMAFVPPQAFVRNHWPASQAASEAQTQDREKRQTLCGRFVRTGYVNPDGTPERDIEYTPCKNEPPKSNRCFTG